MQQASSFHKIGIMTMSFIAYLIQPWRTLCQVTSGIGVVLLPIMLFVPESPRWLIVKQKYEEADQVIHKIAIGKSFFHYLIFFWRNSNYSINSKRFSA